MHHRLARPRLVAACLGFGAWILVVAAMYPGTYSPDSVYMGKQALGELPLATWHPPILVLAWRLLATIFGSLTAVWVAQAALLGLVTYLVARNLKSMGGIIALSGILVLPPMLGQLLPLWKDTQLSLLWMATVALALRPQADQGRRWRFALVVCSLILTIMRLNSLALAAVPIALIIDGRSDLCRKQCHSWGSLAARVRNSFLMVALMAGVSAMFLAISLFTVGDAVADVDDDPQHNVKAWDLVGIGIRTGQIDLPEATRRTPPCTMTELRAQYSPFSSDPLIFSPNSCIRLNLPMRTRVPGAGIPTGFWISRVSENPVAYAKHRASVAGQLLGFTRHPHLVATTLTNAPGTQDLVGKSKPRIPWRVARKYLYLSLRWPYSLMFRPITWIASLFVVAPPLLRGPRRRGTVWVLGGTALHLLVLILSSPAADVRYSFAILGTVLVLTVFAVDDWVKSEGKLANENPPS